MSHKSVVKAKKTVAKFELLQKKLRNFIEGFLKQFHRKLD